MKTFFAIVLIFWMNTELRAQETKNVFSTRYLANIAERFGPDSCLKQMGTRIPIHLVDTALANLLTSTYTHGKSFFHFTQFIAIGLSLKNDEIKSKTIRIVSNYSSSMHDIDEEYLFVLLFQGDSTTIPILQGLMQIWKHRADSIKAKYPSDLTGFFHRFRGLPRYEQFHSTCRRNEYKLAWTIYKLDSSKMSAKIVEAIRKQIVPPQGLYEMSGYNGYHYTSPADTIQLSQHYHTIDEIDLDHEASFIKYKDEITGPMCRNTLITNNSRALYSIGCQWAPLSGRGRTLRLTLLDGNKLIISVIESWIS